MRELNKKRVRRVTRAVAELFPGLVAFVVFRVVADLDTKNPQPAQRRLQRQTAVGLSDIHFHQQVSRQRFFGQTAGAAEDQITQFSGTLQVAERKFTARLFDVEHKVRHRPGIAQRPGGLYVAQCRMIIARALRPPCGQQAEFAKHLPLRSGLDAVQSSRHVVHGAEQQFVPRRLARGLGQQAGGGQVQVAFFTRVQQRKGGFLHPVVGKGVLFFRQHNELRHHRRVQRVTDFRHRHPDHPAQHLQLARAAKTGDAAQQSTRFVGHIFELFQHQGDDVFGVMPGSDRLQIVLPFILVLVVDHQTVINNAAEKLMHEQRVTAGFLVDQRGEIGGRGAADAK